MKKALFSNIRGVRNSYSGNTGLTLLEVLLSIIMAGVVITMVLQLYLFQYRLLHGVIHNTELRYSVLRAGQVLADVIAEAEQVEWTGNELNVKYRKSGVVYQDAYYLADKDYNGIVDLYREHLSVPNPIASYIFQLNISQPAEGLWNISVGASKGSHVVYWERKVRQRLCLE